MTSELTNDRGGGAFLRNTYLASTGRHIAIYFEIVHQGNNVGDVGFDLVSFKRCRFVAFTSAPMVYEDQFEIALQS